MDIDKIKNYVRNGIAVGAGVIIAASPALAGDTLDKAFNSKKSKLEKYLADGALDLKEFKGIHGELNGAKSDSLSNLISNYVGDFTVPDSVTNKKERTNIQKGINARTAVYNMIVNDYRIAQKFFGDKITSSSDISQAKSVETSPLITFGYGATFIDAKGDDYNFGFTPDQGDFNLHDLDKNINASYVKNTIGEKAYYNLLTKIKSDGKSVHTKKVKDFNKHWINIPNDTAKTLTGNKPMGYGIRMSTLMDGKLFNYEAKHGKVVGLQAKLPKGVSNYKAFGYKARNNVVNK
jgi:hypothetical protein